MIYSLLLQPQSFRHVLEIRGFSVELLELGTGARLPPQILVDKSTFVTQGAEEIIGAAFLAAQGGC